MSVAYVVGGQILEYDIPYPQRWRRLTDGQEVAVRDGTEADRQACGFFAITLVPRPTTAVDERADRTVEMVNGTPTEVWTVRDETAQEFQDRHRKETNVTLRDAQRARNFINASVAFRALANPTNLEFRNHLRLTSLAVEELLRQVIGGELLDDA